MWTIAFFVACATAWCPVGSAWAEPAAGRDYFAKPADQAIKFRLDRPRSRGQRIFIAASFGAGVLLAGGGLAFHLDSRRAADQVSARGFTGRLYTDELDAVRDRALRSRNLAIVGYSLGAACAAVGVAALIITQPGAELLDAEGPATRVSFTPLAGGAVVTSTWTLP